MESIQYIDFNMDAFVKESMLAMHYSKGGLTLEELRDMPFDIYEMYVKEAIRIQEDMKSGNEKMRKGETENG